MSSREMVASSIHPKVAIGCAVHRIRGIIVSDQRFEIVKLRRGAPITIPIFKRGGAFLPNPASEVHFVSNDGGDDKAENTVSENEGRGHHHEDKGQGLYDQKDFVVFIHALRGCLKVLKNSSSFIVGIFFAKDKKQKIHGKNTACKEGQKIVNIVGEEGRNQQKRNTNQTTDNLKGMGALVILKSFKKPVQFCCLNRHVSSLKSLVNSTLTIAFITHCTK